MSMKLLLHTAQILCLILLAGTSLGNVVRKRRDDACGNPECRLTQNEKDLAVSVHNKWRAQVGASNIRSLKWNEELAMMAQKLADRCLYEHEEKALCTTSGIAGQNIYVLGLDINAKLSQEFLDGHVERAITAWYNEINGYNITTNKCDPASKFPCGHYTQLAWAETTEVGCAANLCAPWYEYVKTHNGKGLFLVCNYLSPGNLYGGRPFIPGPACSNCAPVVRSVHAKCVDSVFCEPCSNPDTDSACKFASFKCYNGGVFNYGTNLCDCSNGFYGRDCSHVVPNGCANGGVFNGNRQLCDCPDKYCGDTCTKKDAVWYCSYYPADYCLPSNMYHLYMMANCWCWCDKKKYPSQLKG